MMSFLAPFMLFGALAAGIPIALHFFYRSRFRDVPWAAMKFLLTAIEQTSRRLRFQELLLLILRVALLLLLALALARPMFRSVGHAGGAVDVVLVVDRSMSMSARAGVAPPEGKGDVYLSALRSFAAPDGSVTRFDRARAAALAVLASLPSGSTAQVIGMSDRATLLGPRVPSHLDAAKSLVEQLTLTDAGTDLEPAITQAVALLEAGPSPGKELYLFGDMQGRGFEANPRKLSDTLATVRDRVGIHLVRCGSDEITNVALAGITPQSTLRSGERADFAVLLRNTGTRAARNIVVSLEMNGKAESRETQAVAEIPAGETRAVVLSAMVDRPGRHVVSAMLKTDDLPGDNRIDQVIRVNDQVGVLLVDGSPDTRDPRRSASFFLHHALNPTASPGLPITTVSAERAAPRDLGGKEVCILVNARLEAKDKDESNSLSPEFTRALAEFVKQGRGVMVFPGDRVEPEPYNRLLFDQLRLLPYRIGKVENTPESEPWLIERGSGSGPFARFREEQGYATLDRIESRRRLLLDTPTGDEEKQLAEESRVLLKYRDGKPAAASRKRPNQGEVIMFTSSVHDPNWSDWFIAPAFVPMMQVALNHLLEGRPEALNRVAGERLEWQVSKADEEQNFDLVRPDGSTERLGFPVSQGGRNLLTSNDLTRAGLYRIIPVGTEANDDAPLFAVAPDVRETDNLRSLTSAQIDERLGFSVKHLIAGDDGAAFADADRSRGEWTTWLLWLLLVLVLGEMALAWWCGRAW